MGFFGLFSGSKYDDDKITRTAESAIRNHPLLKKETNVTVVSEEGVVQLIGTVKVATNKKKIMGEVKKRLKSLNYESIDNKLHV